MFKYNDKLTLSLINATDIEGNFIPFCMKLPLRNKEYELPNKITSLELYEYQEGTNTNGFPSYRFFIGKKATFNEIITNINNQRLTINKGINITALDLPVCYQETPEQITIFAVVNEQDIVLEDQEQLKLAIESLSDEFSNLLENINNIKVPTLKKSLTNNTHRIVRI